MDITVKQGMEEPNDIIVGKEKDGEHNYNKYFRYCSEMRNVTGGTNTTNWPVYIGKVTTTAVSEGLPDLM